jgi:hypothetical protein
MHLSRLFMTLVALVAGSCPLPSQSAAETVGKAVSVRTAVTGDKGVLKRADPVNRNERISTNVTGLGQFEFVDGTKLAVGPNSSIIIDEYVLGSGNQVAKLTINTTQGALRWISGKSPSSAYQIATPVGTLGVRGTAIDLYLNDNLALMVLLNGSGEWCNEGRCVTVDRSCSFIVARGGTDISDPQQVSLTALASLGGAQGLYFFSNVQRLHPAFRTVQNTCGLGNRIRGKANSREPKSQDRTQDRSQDQGQEGGPIQER